MSVSIDFIKPNVYAIEHIALNMRQADRDEIWASDHLTPWRGVTESLKMSHYSSIAVIDDEPIAAFGLVVANILGSTGVPWLPGTDAITKYFRAFIRHSFVLTSQMNEKCDTLVNYVHAENINSVKLLRAVGFTIDDPVPFGVEGELFHRFHKENKQCVSQH